MGSIKNYSVDINDNNGTGTTGSNYNWYVSNSFNGVITKLNTSGNQVQVNWQNSPAGNYTLFVEEINGLNCSKIITLNVKILSNPVVKIEDQIVCVDTSNNWLTTPVFHTNLNTSVYQFEWYFNNVLLPVTTSYLAPTQIGTYKVLIKNKTTNCSSFSEAKLLKSPPLSGFITMSDDFSDESIIQVYASGGSGPYLYSINGVDFQSNPVFSVAKSGEYTITIKDQSDCNFLELCACVFIYDKFFTPNNDGLNDFWTVNTPNKEKKVTVTIFDRYGKLIKEFDPTIDVWDGKFNKESLYSSDYWFVVNYLNCSGETKQFKSHFTLKR
jgi:gliding motility-associated-like protein